MRNLIKRILRESLLLEKFQEDSYHVTDIKDLLSIIRENRINLSTWLNSPSDRFGEKFFFLSLSRTGFPGLAFGTNSDRNFSRIVFDGNKLNNKFSSLPVNFFRGLKTSPNRNFEFEERLVSDNPYIDNISKYIKRIEILLFDRDSYFFNILKALIKECNERNIQIDVYENANDLVKKKNKINTDDLDKSYINYKRLDDYSDDNYYLLIALIMYDKKYVEDFDLFERDFNKFIKANNIEYINPMGVYDKMVFYYENPMSKYYTNLKNSIWYVFGTGRHSFINIIKPIVRDMRNIGVTNINSYINKKIKGGSRYSDTWAIYTQYNRNNVNKSNAWIVEENDKLLKYLETLWFKEMKDGERFLSEEDFKKYVTIRDMDGTIGDWINYLMGKYPLSVVKNIISKSAQGTGIGYQAKLDKI